MERFLIGSDSEILVGPGLIDGEVLPDSIERRKAAVVTHAGATHLGRKVRESLREAGLAAELRVLPDGEEAKSLSVIEGTYRWLAELGLARGDTLVAVGGGTVTDVGGFVAATYLRGIEAVYVPTTLLGAVDASIGGKTGVNLDGKNMIGAFRHPSRVIIDVDLLLDLPDALWREGVAEAVKAGLIADAALVELFEAQGRDAPIGEVVRRAVAVKVGVVADDFTEQGRRTILNYGHTVGHAVERASGCSHGEAVAIGMVAAAAASTVAAGFTESERQNSLLASLGLPTNAASTSESSIRRLLEMDKKRDATGLRMVLLRAIADPIVDHVAGATVDTALDAIGVLGT